MSGLVLKVSKKALRAAEKEVRGHAKKLRKAQVRALNKTAVTMRKRASDAVRQVTNIKAAAAKKQIAIKRARANDLRSGLNVIHKPVPLSAFSGARQTKTGVSVQMRKDKPRKFFKGAFAAVMPTGHKGFFIRDRRAKSATGRDSKGRVKKGRLPIKQLYGTNVQSVFVDKIAVIESESIKVLNKNLDHEVKYEMSK